MKSSGNWSLPEGMESSCMDGKEKGLYGDVCLYQETENGEAGGTDHRCAADKGTRYTCIRLLSQGRNGGRTSNKDSLTALGFRSALGAEFCCRERVRAGSWRTLAFSCVDAAFRAELRTLAKLGAAFYARHLWRLPFCRRSRRRISRRRRFACRMSDTATVAADAATALAAPGARSRRRSPSGRRRRIPRRVRHPSPAPPPSFWAASRRASAAWNCMYF